MGADRPVRLLQVTDSHLRAAPDGQLKGWRTRDSLQLALSAALDGAAPPDAILATGDLSQDGSPESYRHFRDILGDLGVPVLCIPGNHDHPGNMAAELSAPPFRYCGDHAFGAWRLVMLSTWDGDRGGGRLSPGELRRLASAVERSREPHVLVVLHHHPVPTESWLDKVALDNTDEFFAVTDSCARIRGMVWGHVHQVQESYRRGVRMLATPSTCFQFMPRVSKSDVDPAAGPGWRWLELLPDGRIVTQVEHAPKPAGFGA
jgi:3',5'-cyclic-AMP phosphodiesterase